MEIVLTYICLQNTYFSFQNKFYEQVEGTAMESPSVPYWLNCIWNILKRKPSILPLPPRHWFTFMDDTFVIQQEAHKHVLLDHVNNIDPPIKFTVEIN